MPDAAMDCTYPSAARALTAPEEAGVFARLRWRHVVTTIVQAARTSPLRSALLAVLTVLLWSGVYIIFFEAFQLLEIAVPSPALRARTVQIVFNLFFLSLTIMITLSSAVIFYASIFITNEVKFLLTTPASPQRIVLHKYQDTLFLSCWGFLLLGSPMLLAYGSVATAPWYYFAMLLPFVVAFVCLPSSLGVCICLTVIYFLPKYRWHALGLTGIACVGMLSYAGITAFGSSDDTSLSQVWFQDVFTRLSFVEQRLLPSWWLSMGLLEAAHPVRNSWGGPTWQQSVGYFNVLLANALLVPFVVRWLGDRTLRTGYGQIRGLGPTELPFSLNFIDTCAGKLIRPLPRRMQTLLLKDFRMFRRDPLHWGQFLIFAGLLCLYFFTIPRFDYGSAFRLWMVMVGFLNLGAIGLILSTFTTRFIFPMISLEGQRFWILGTLPMRRDDILWSKFLFATAVSVPPCTLLVFLSDWLLGVIRHFPLIAGMHQVTCLVLCLGLCALSVGIGARLPNLHEPSPARITAGFGGTLTLMLSAIFILVTVAGTALPGYCYVSRAQAGPLPHVMLHYLGGPWGLIGGLTFTLAMGCVTTWFPLRSGIQHFRRLEF